MLETEKQKKSFIKEKKTGHLIIRALEINLMTLNINVELVRGIWGKKKPHCFTLRLVCFVCFTNLTLLMGGARHNNISAWDGKNEMKVIRTGYGILILEIAIV